MEVYGSKEVVFGQKDSRGGGGGGGGGGGDEDGDDDDGDDGDDGDDEDGDDNDGDDEAAKKLTPIHNFCIFQLEINCNYFCSCNLLPISSVQLKAVR